METKEKIRIVDIEARNREFQAMTITEKRLTVLKDLKSYLETKTLVAEHNKYVVIQSGPRFLTEEFAQLHEVIGNAPCEVCAVGGLFMAQIGRENHFDLAQFDDAYGAYNAGRFMLAAEHFQDRLTQLWPMMELRTIEYVFEGRWYGDFDGLYNGPVRDQVFAFRAANGFGSYTPGDVILPKIVEVMLENEGRFIIPGITLEIYDGEEEDDSETDDA